MNKFQKDIFNMNTSGQFSWESSQGISFVNSDGGICLGVSKHFEVEVALKEILKASSR